MIFVPHSAFCFPPYFNSLASTNDPSASAGCQAVLIVELVMNSAVDAALTSLLCRGLEVRERSRHVRVAHPKMK